MLTAAGGSSRPKALLRIVPTAVVWNPNSKDNYYRKWSRALIRKENLHVFPISYIEEGWTGGRMKSIWMQLIYDIFSASNEVYSFPTDSF